MKINGLRYCLTPIFELIRASLKVRLHDPQYQRCRHWMNPLMGGPVTPPGNKCGTCLHYRGLVDVDPQPEMEGVWLPACKAFPAGIPDEL